MLGLSPIQRRTGLTAGISIGGPATARFFFVRRICKPDLWATLGQGTSSAQVLSSLSVNLANGLPAPF